MRLGSLSAVALWIASAVAINYGSLEGQQDDSDKVSKLATTKTKKSPHSKASRTSLQRSSVTSPISSGERSTSTLTSISTQKTITYAEDPLTTVTTTDELGRTTVKPLWWIPSEASQDGTATTATEIASGIASEDHLSHGPTALGKRALSSDTTDMVVTQSNAGGNVVANLGLAGSMVMILMNLV